MSSDIIKKIKIVGLIFIFSFLILGGRLFQLQVIQGERYQYLSEGNRTDYRPIMASRGRIWANDDQGVTIFVSNRISYTASIIPANISIANYDSLAESRKSVATNIAAILQLDADEVLAKIEQGPRSSPIRLKRHLTPYEVVSIEEKAAELPGVFIEKTPVRDYIYGNTAAHLLGYVGEISREELNALFHHGYRAGDLIGKVGLEKYYEPYLRGEDGLRQIEVNSVRLEVATLGVKPPSQGADIYLSLNIPLQIEVENLLREKIRSLQDQALYDPSLKGGPTGGAAVVLEAKTGRVLAMASYPTYDLTQFIGAMNVETFNQMQQNPHQPFLDRTIQITIPAGSVFKVMTGVTALEELTINPQSMLLYCTGEFRLGNHVWKCWKEGGHGALNFYEAMAYSSNVAFYQLGHQLSSVSGERLQHTAREFGFGYLTGIDLPSERAGLIPDQQWKRTVLNEPWYPGDMINLSIGQGSLLVTPIQVANMMGAIANDGLLMQPYLVDKVVDQKGNIVFENAPNVLNKIEIAPRTLSIIQQSLQDVVNYGTAARLMSNFPLKIAGKTGTAQTSSGQDLASHGWFAGYAPFDNPEIVFAVFIEHGNDSAYALEVARGLLEAYF